MQNKKLFILISLGLVLISLLAIFNLREKKAKDSERFVGVTNTTKLSIIREEAEPQIKFDTIWEKYSNKEMGVEFKYPLSWGSPSVKGKTISFDHFGYQDNHIIVYPKNKEAFLCSGLEEYDFMCGGYVFTCDSKVDYFDCEQYYYKKTEGGYDYAGYDEDAIVNALNGRGLKCNKSEAQIRYDVYELPELIESQFRLLEKISKVTKIDGSLEKEIKSDFNLFEFCWQGGGTVDRDYVDLIDNALSDMQGIRIIGYNGSDVSAGNYYYRAAFLKNNKIISVKFPLFLGDLEIWADNEMFKDGEVNLLEKKMEDVIKNKNKDSVIYKIIEEYDRFVQTLHLIP